MARQYGIVLPSYRWWCAREEKGGHTVLNTTLVQPDQLWLGVIDAKQQSLEVQSSAGVQPYCALICTVHEQLRRADMHSCSYADTLQRCAGVQPSSSTAACCQRAQVIMNRTSSSKAYAARSKFSFSWFSFAIRIRDAAVAAD